MPARISAATARTLGIGSRPRRSSSSKKSSRKGVKRPSLPLTRETAQPCDFFVGVETYSQASGATTHWAVVAKRRERQRNAAMTEAALWKKLTGWTKPARCVVSLMRVSGGRVDHDNLAICCKACRDGIADALGYRNDRESSSLDWRYAQRVQRGVFGVEVTVGGGE